MCKYVFEIKDLNPDSCWKVYFFWILIKSKQNKFAYVQLLRSLFYFISSGCLSYKWSLSSSMVSFCPLVMQSRHKKSKWDEENLDPGWTTLKCNSKSSTFWAWHINPHKLHLMQYKFLGNLNQLIKLIIYPHNTKC